MTAPPRPAPPPRCALLGCRHWAIRDCTPWREVTPAQAASCNAEARAILEPKAER